MKKEKFIKIIIHRLNNDTNSPLFGKIDINIESFLSNLILILMTNDEDTSTGFEFVYSLYEEKNNSLKLILPLIKRNLSIFQNILNFDITNFEVLEFIFTNLDNTLNSNILMDMKKINKLINLNQINKLKNNNEYENINILKFF